MSVITLERVCVTRGASSVVHDVDLTIPPGDVTVLLGANGAGKTTLLEAISGILSCASGRILLDGAPVQRLSRVRRARAGIVHVEQGRAVFPGLTVTENLAVASPDGDVSAALELFPELRSRAEVRAGLLSGGEQQMLVLARALLTEPKVLLIDELSLGLAPVIVRRLMPVVRRLADQGIAVLLVEQYAALALGIGDRASVLSQGRVVFDGACKDLTDDADVLRGAYLRV